MSGVIPASEFWPGAREIRAASSGEATWAMIGCRDGEQFLFAVPFDQHDAGRAQSSRPKQTNDCTVRALATASGVKYDTAYDTLMLHGRKAGRRFDFKSWAKRSTFHGNQFEWTGFPAVKGMWRVNPVLFALKFPEGRFVLRTAKHVLACVDGRISDEGRGAEASCVYGAWQLVRLGA